MKLLYIIFAFVVAALVGCGGGGGSAPASMSMRQIQPGDVVEYAQEFSSGVFDGPLPMTITVLAEPNTAPTYGSRVLRVRENNNNNIKDLDSLCEQGADGTLYRHNGLLGAGSVVSRTGTPILCPSPLFVGETYSYSAVYNDKSFEETHGKVVACELVEGYQTYKIHEDITIHHESSGLPSDIPFDSTISQDCWYAPALGYIVKQQSVDSETGTKMVMRITSKNF